MNPPPATGHLHALKLLGITTALFFAAMVLSIVIGWKERKKP